MVENTGALGGFHSGNDEAAAFARVIDGGVACGRRRGAANEMLRYEDERTDVMKTMLTELHDVHRHRQPGAARCGAAVQQSFVPVGCVSSPYARSSAGAPALPADWDLMQLVASYESRVTVRIAWVR